LAHHWTCLAFAGVASNNMPAIANKPAIEVIEDIAMITLLVCLGTNLADARGAFAIGMIASSVSCQVGKLFPHENGSARHDLGVGFLGSRLDTSSSP
jgi:hypothetical protein